MSDSLRSPRIDSILSAIDVSSFTSRNMSKFFFLRVKDFRILFLANGSLTSTNSTSFFWFFYSFSPSIFSSLTKWLSSMSAGEINVSPTTSTFFFGYCFCSPSYLFPVMKPFFTRSPPPPKLYVGSLTHGVLEVLWYSSSIFRCHLAEYDEVHLV